MRQEFRGFPSSIVFLLFRSSGLMLEGSKLQPLLNRDLLKTASFTRFPWEFLKEGNSRALGTLARGYIGLKRGLRALIREFLGFEKYFLST